jgi:hypothetical protein
MLDVSGRCADARRTDVFVTEVLRGSRLIFFCAGREVTSYRDRVEEVQ